MDELNLESSEKALNNSIIPTVSTTTHAENRIVLSEHFSEKMRSILRASIGMDKEFLGWFSPRTRTLERE